MKIERIDHIVLTVQDMDATIKCYTTVLGMEEITFGEDRKALTFGKQKINLHPAGNEYPPIAKQPVPGSADICFITVTPIAQVARHIESNDVEIIEGPVKRSGATGEILSIYFFDPDGNLIEISNYV